jgi:ubiquinone/menaquinone biosynthesis C-methylase UbiE
MAHDFFSQQAPLYARYRPTYPEALFQFLFENTDRFERAWDCATGSGQAAVRLAKRFEEVRATDLSEAQLKNAWPAERVHYQLTSAEATPFPDHHFDLITVAQALHWLDHDSFYQEVKRVARPQALLACWGYGFFRISPDIDLLTQWYYQEVVGPYWPARRRHIETHYQHLPFPFPPIPAPEFEMVESWPLEFVLGYLNTWSASQRYRDSLGKEPLDSIRAELQKLWGDPAEKKNIRWPLFLRLGRVN